MAAEGSGTVANTNEEDPKGLPGNVVLEGQFPQLGEFKLEVTRGPETNQFPNKAHQAAFKEQPLDRTIYSSMKVQPKDIWRTKGLGHLDSFGSFS